MSVQKLKNTNVYVTEHARPGQKKPAAESNKYLGKDKELAKAVNKKLKASKNIGMNVKLVYRVVYGIGIRVTLLQAYMYSF